MIPFYSPIDTWKKNKIRTLPVVDEKGILQGVMTMKDIAMSLIKGDYFHLKNIYD